MSAKFTFREIHGLGKFLRLLLVLGIILDGASLVSSLLQFELLGRPEINALEAEANDTREQVIGVLGIVVLLITFVIFGRWIVRANRNVRALGALDLRVSPGWAVGYFFIPVVNLWQPYHAMKDLWRASQNPLAWTKEKTDFILPTWWTLWILSGVLGRIAFQLSLNAETLQELRFSTGVQVVIAVISIALSLVALRLVAHITQAQTETATLRPALPPLP